MDQRYFREYESEQAEPSQDATLLVSAARAGLWGRRCAPLTDGKAYDRIVVSDAIAKG